MRFYLEEKYPQIYKIVRNIAEVYIRLKSREKKKEFGLNNPDKTFYVIRIRREKLGLMAQYITILGHIKYAVSKGYYPIVDLKNYPNTYLDSDLLHKVNAWEYYFEQPIPYSLEEVYTSKNVVLSNMETPKEGSPRYLYTNCLNDEKRATEYYKLIKKYIRFNKETEDYIENEYNRIFTTKIKQERVLGVVCRGTDLLNFTQHSKQPTMDELISNVKELMKKHNCRYLYVASDSEKSLKYICDAVGRDKVLYTEQKRFDCFEHRGEKVLSDIHFERENDSYLKGKEYLTVVALLARCNVIYGSLVGATVGAMCISQGKIEHVEIFDQGTYN